MTVLTEDEFYNFSYNPPPWWGPNEWAESIHKEDLCLECKGYGEVDFGQFHPGTKCGRCDGVGLANKEKRHYFLTYHKAKGLVTRNVSLSTLEQVIEILEKEKDGR